MPERIRLHISPFNPDLLSTILSTSGLSTASNISYHTLPTFPERNYGYVELPILEAERIKKKFQGSTLRGIKMKIEDARPEKIKPSSEDGKKSKGKREKRESEGIKTSKGALPGCELPNGRKVKRGWTEPAAKDLNNRRSTKGKKDSQGKKPKTQTTSSFTKEAECLFRANIPANACDLPVPETKKRKRSKLEEEVVVHEFSNTTKHATFTRDNNVIESSKPTAQYVDGKGWVNADGKVVESVPSTRSNGREVKSPRQSEKDTKTKGSHPVSQARVTSKVAQQSQRESDQTSSSGSSSTSSEDNDDDENDDGDRNSKLSGHITRSGTKAHPSQRSKGRISENSGAVPDPPPNNDTLPTEQPRDLPSFTISSSGPPKAVHPLESLFKRPDSSTSATPRKPNLEVKTSFSFFEPDADADPDDNDSTRRMPQTPFTQRDLQFRSIRSAAPTPDTAAPNRTAFGPVWGRADDDADDDDDDDDDGEEEADHDGGSGRGQTPTGKKAAPAVNHAEEKVPESDFAQWFWEHRGETNRAWKRRKREAGKEKRQRDNKRRGEHLS